MLNVDHISDCENNPFMKKWEEKHYKICLYKHMHTLRPGEAHPQEMYVLKNWELR